MLSFIWQKESPPEKITPELMQQRVRKYEEYAVYVTDERTREEMLNGLAHISAALKEGDLTTAKSDMEIVKHIYVMARYSNKVLKYKSYEEGAIALLHLTALCVAFAIGYNYMKPAFDTTSYKVFLAIIGGGLGGIAIVVLGLLGVQVQTSAMIHRRAWFVLKPISGAIMGLVTYCAVDIAAQTIAGGSSAGSIARPFAAFLLGFLGGFFETFANKALLRAAKLEE